MLAMGLAAAGIVIAAALTLRAFEDNMMFYIEISDVIEGNTPKNRNFRVHCAISLRFRAIGEPNFPNNFQIFFTYNRFFGNPYIK